MSEIPGEGEPHTNGHVDDLSRPYNISRALGRLRRLLLALSCIIFTVQVLRYLLYTFKDPDRCQTLLSDGGFFLDAPPDGNETHGFRRWQPHGCKMHNYAWQDVEKCIPNGRIVFAGDSTVFNPYIKLVAVYDEWEADDFIADVQTHRDFYNDLGSIQAHMVWDPYLNSTASKNEIAAVQGSPHTKVKRPADFLFIGTGLWWPQQYTATYLDMFADSLEPILHQTDALDNRTNAVLDSSVPWNKRNLFLFNPVHVANMSEVVENDKVWVNTEFSIRMNKYLHDTPRPSGAEPVLSFNGMTPWNGAMRKWNGYHAASTVVATKTQLLLNYRCNQVLSDLGEEMFQSRGLCCSTYPRWSISQWVLAITFVSSAIIFFRTRIKTPAKLNNAPNLGQKYQNVLQNVPLALIGALACCVLVDRTWFVDKQEKYFSPTIFFLSRIAVIFLGLFTVTFTTPTEVPLGYLESLLSRTHTDEWKGWMALLMTAFEYFGPYPREDLQHLYYFMTASFVFLFGYGNTRSILAMHSGNGHSPERTGLVQRVVRLNLLPACLAIFVTSSTGWLNLYLSLLLTTCLIILDTTLAIVPTVNDRILLCTGKLISSAALIACLNVTPLIYLVIRPFIRAPWAYFPSTSGSVVFNASIVALYLGAICAVLLQKASRNASPMHSAISNGYGHKPTFSESESGTSPRTSTSFKSGWRVILLIAFLSTVLFHDYVPSSEYLSWRFLRTRSSTANTVISASSIPFLVLLYPALRALPIVRSMYSPALAGIGRHAFELFLLRQHLLLGADGSAVLRLGWFDRWAPFGIEGLMWIWLGRTIESILFALLLFWTTAKLAGGGEIRGLVNGIDWLWARGLEKCMGRSEDSREQRVAKSAQEEEFVLGEISDYDDDDTPDDGDLGHGGRSSLSQKQKV